MATYVIEPPRVHWQRPRWPYRIDWTSEITHNLIGAWMNEGASVLSTPPEFARVNPPMVGNPAVTGQPHFGPGLSFDGTDDEGTIAIPASDNQTDVSVAVWATLPTTQAQFSRVIEKGANDAWLLNVNETGLGSQSRVAFHSRVGGNTILNTTNGYGDGGVHLFVGRAKLNSGPISLVVDAGTENLSGTTAATAGNYGTGSVYFGRGGGGGEHGTFVLYAAFLWSRYISDGEVSALYAPRTRWQMFSRPSGRVIVDIAAGGFRPWWVHREALNGGCL